MTSTKIVASIVLIVAGAMTAPAAMAQGVVPNPDTTALLTPLAESMAMVAASLEKLAAADPQVGAFAASARALASSLDAVASTHSGLRFQDPETPLPGIPGFPGLQNITAEATCCADCGGGEGVCCQGTSCSAEDGEGCETGGGTKGACEPN